MKKSDIMILTSSLPCNEFISNVVQTWVIVLNTSSFG